MIEIECNIEMSEEGQLYIIWQCPFCSHQWKLKEVDADNICFFAVYHLAAKHGMSAEEIFLHEPLLEGAIKEYFSAIRAEVPLRA